jgi:hypothetical protein
MIGILLNKYDNNINIGEYVYIFSIIHKIYDSYNSLTNSSLATIFYISKLIFEYNHKHSFLL